MMRGDFRRLAGMIGLALMGAGAGLATGATPADAAWMKATSAHFVVYADTREATLRKQASDLEYFDAMVRRFHQTDEQEKAESAKVTVFVMPSISAVQKMSQMDNVAGFYVPRVTGSIAFTPRSGGTDTFDLTPRIVLFHEYAHHFLFGNYAMAYPAWFGEGYAEFVSTMMERDGALWLGGAANHRAYSLVRANGLSIRQLFEPPAKLSDEQRESIYARGWLLTHYIMFDADRRKQFDTYLRLFNAGKPSLEAATESFGDLKVLDRKLGAYLSKSTLPAIRVPKTTFAVPKVDVVPLTPGESAMIGFRMQSTRGVNAKTAGPLYKKAKLVAQPFATDAVAQGWLAEMAFDAGELDASEAAADAALAVDPKAGQALLYKARVHMARAVLAKATDAKTWTEARSWIVKANRAEPNNAAALSLFYESFLIQHVPPTKNAALGLYRASNLVPQDTGTRFLAARQLILDGATDDARKLLRPLASDPHGGRDNGAVRLLALLDGGMSGPAAIEALERPPAPATAAGKDPGAGGRREVSGPGSATGPRTGVLQWRGLHLGGPDATRPPSREGAACGFSPPRATRSFNAFLLGIGSRGDIRRWYSG